MTYEEDVTDTALERARLLQNMLVSRATGGAPDDPTYRLLRSEFMADAETKRLLPEFVRTCRDLTQFWGYIKGKADMYEERRQLLWAAFNPLLDSLEGKNQAPGDSVISDALCSFVTEGVHAYWERALKRRQEDPEGAITLAHAAGNCLQADTRSRRPHVRGHRYSAPTVQ